MQCVSLSPFLLSQTKKGTARLAQVVFHWLVNRLSCGQSMTQMCSQEVSVAALMWMRYQPHAVTLGTIPTQTPVSNAFCSLLKQLPNQTSGFCSLHLSLTIDMKAVIGDTEKGLHWYISMEAYCVVRMLVAACGGSCQFFLSPQGSRGPLTRPVHLPDQRIPAERTVGCLQSAEDKKPVNIYENLTLSSAVHT